MSAAARSRRLGHGPCAGRHLAFCRAAGSVAPKPKSNPAFLSVARQIWIPGLGSALASIGFGAVVTFTSLLFVERGWSPIWLAFTAYAGALIVARLLFGHLPDAIGGAKVAVFCVVIEAAGLALIWLASSGAMAASALRSPASAMRWSFLASAWKLSAAPRLKAGASRWAHTRPASTSPSVLQDRLWGWSRAALGWGRSFSSARSSCCAPRAVALRLIDRPAPASSR